MDVAPVSRSSADIGIGIHREQEGVDRPYSMEIASSSGSVISSLKGQRGTDQTSGTLVDTTLEATMILGYLQLGVEVVYRSKEETTENKTTTAQKTSKKNEVKLGGGPVLKFNFGNLDAQLTVPFAYAAAAYIIDEFKFNDAQNESYTGIRIHGGAGIHLFLDSNVSFAPKIEYINENLSGDDSKIQSQKGVQALLQLGIFL